MGDYRRPLVLNNKCFMATREIEQYFLAGPPWFTKNFFTGKMNDEKNLKYLLFHLISYKEMNFVQRKSTQ